MAKETEPARSPEGIKRDPFDNADFYDDGEGGPLIHESPEDAIAAIIDAGFGRNVTEAIEKNCPLQVTAWARKKVTEDWIANEAERMAEDLNDSIEESFGDPDGYHEDRIVEQSDLQTALADLIREQTADCTPYQCERVGTRVYSAQEVEAILRQECPEWFE